MLTAEWLRIVLDFSTENYNPVSENNLANIRSEAWINLFWESVNGKLFAVHSQKSKRDESSCKMTPLFCPLPPPPNPPPVLLIPFPARHTPFKSHHLTLNLLYSCYSENQPFSSFIPSFRLSNSLCNLRSWIFVLEAYQIVSDQLGAFCLSVEVFKKFVALSLQRSKAMFLLASILIYSKKLICNHLRGH
jgi:hypothetical protein